jgi:phosphatidylglycerol---prolipoprotein diacylglyceryl transferase
VPRLAALRPVIELAFDPLVQVGDWTVRLQTIALALVILLALLAAAVVARRTPIDPRVPADELVLPADAPDSRDDRDPAGQPALQANHLRRDDLLFIVVASLPGAVLGGRLGYWLLHLDYYGTNPGAILDIGQGGLQLSLAVVGGVLTGSVVASLLGAPVGRWLHAATLPLLLAIAGGKATMALGGEGQGLPFDGPVATAYLGPGPWLSLAPELPSHPAQLYEALATIAVLAVLGALLAGGRFAGRTGSVFLLGLALWASARFAVAFAWRDPAIAGPLRADQLLSLALAGGAAVGLVLARVRDRRARTGGAGPGLVRAPGEPEWPDPETRPTI